MPNASRATDSKRTVFYVAMTDRFMSGWGMAKGKRNTFVVECDTHEQATAVFKAAGDRSEMSRVRMVRTLPRSTSGSLVSVRHFSELGGPWLDYYRPA